jgi:cell division protein FtsL
LNSNYREICLFNFFHRMKLVSDHVIYPMTTLKSLANPLKAFIKRITIQKSLAFLLAAVMLAVTLVPDAAKAVQSTRTIQDKTENILQDDESNRPKTTREWRKEARETEGKPFERAQRIVKETADAVEDWAELYPDVAERSIPALEGDEG